VLQSEINAGTENKTRLEIHINQVRTDFFFKKKDWFIALRCTIVYTNDHKTAPDTSLLETSDRI
jgi:hypothetical protein